MFVRTDAEMWQAVAHAFERNAGTFDLRAALRLLSGPRVRTQAREGRTQVRAHPGIGGRAFDRRLCVRPHCLCLIFQEHKQTVNKRLKIKLKVNKNEQKQ
jgi:hypothetical protein